MLGFLASGLVILAVATTSGVAAGDDRQPPLKVTTRRDEDRVEVKVEKDRAICSVRGPSGIGQAVIERTGETWPDALMLRLHLSGLENFRASNGKVTLVAAVSSHVDDRRVRLWKDGQEGSLLDARSPYWMEIRMIGGGGEPTEGIPLRNGYFEMQLPKAFFEGNPKSITVDWIDFYRR